MYVQGRTMRSLFAPFVRPSKARATQARIRRGILFSVFVTGSLLMGSHAPVFAETVQFEARLLVNIPRFDPCDNGVLICGIATITGFGDAEYALTVNSLEPSSDACISPSGTSTGGAYHATATFTLPDGSKLTVSEEGLVCGPGVSLMAPASWRTYGKPVDGSGKWVVQSATGQFALFNGDGTDTFHTAGANFNATYLGTLTR